MSMPDFPIDPELRIRARPPVSTAPHNGGCRVYSEDDTEPTWPRLARRTAKLRGSPGRVECDGSRGPPRTASRGGRPADRGENSARFCPRARSVSRRLDRSRAMLARAVRSGAARKARLCIQLAKL